MAKKFPVEILFDFMENYRVKHGMTRRELYEKIGISKQQISFMKHNTSGSNIKTVTKIALGLGVPVKDILEYVPAGDVLSANNNYFFRNLPKEIKNWMRTPHGREWILRGYVDYREKMDKENKKVGEEKSKEEIEELRDFISQIAEKIL